MKITAIDEKARNYIEVNGGFIIVDMIMDLCSWKPSGPAPSVRMGVPDLEDLSGFISYEVDGVPVYAGYFFDQTPGDDRQITLKKYPWGPCLCLVNW